MTKFTGKLTSDNVAEFAQENNCRLRVNGKKGTNKKYAIETATNDVQIFDTLRDAVKYIEKWVVDNSEKTDLEVIECKDIVETLKTAKNIISWRNADNYTHKLLIAVNNNQFMAVCHNGIEYAIAKCELQTTENFTAVIPLEKSNGKEIGFCPFMQAITKQGIDNDFTYSIDSKSECLTAIANNSEFNFKLLPLDSFDISSELQVIIDEFMKDDKGYQTLDVYEIESTEEDKLTDVYGEVILKKSHNHICFDGCWEYFIYDDCVRKVHRSNTLGLQDVINDRYMYRSGSSLLGSPENIITWYQSSVKSGKGSVYPQALIDYLYPMVYTGQCCELPVIESIEVTETTDVIEDIQSSENNTQFVPGIGNIDLIPVNSLQVGMYLYYGDLLYTVNKIEQVNFINTDSNYIVTVHSLINAVDKKQILLSDSDRLTAWSVNFKSENKVKEDKPKQANKAIEIEIKPFTDNNDNLPSPIRTATHDRGIKGNGRDMLIKMLSIGATLDQIMASFNWSNKTASNHMTYVRQWGYNLKRKNDTYQIV